MKIFILILLHLIRFVFRHFYSIFLESGTEFNSDWIQSKNLCNFRPQLMYIYQYIIKVTKKFTKIE